MASSHHAGTQAMPQKIESPLGALKNDLINAQRNLNSKISAYRKFANDPSIIKLFQELGLPEVLDLYKRAADSFMEIKLMMTDEGVFDYEAAEVIFDRIRQINSSIFEYNRIVSDPKNKDKVDKLNAMIWNNDDLKYFLKTNGALITYRSVNDNLFVTAVETRSGLYKKALRNLSQDDNVKKRRLGVDGKEKPITLNVKLEIYDALAQAGVQERMRTEEFTITINPGDDIAVLINDQVLRKLGSGDRLVKVATTLDGEKIQFKNEDEMASADRMVNFLKYHLDMMNASIAASEANTPEEKAVAKARMSEIEGQRTKIEKSQSKLLLGDYVQDGYYKNLDDLSKRVAQKSEYFDGLYVKIQTLLEQYSGSYRTADIDALLKLILAKIDEFKAFNNVETDINKVKGESHIQFEISNILQTELKRINPDNKKRGEYTELLKNVDQFLAILMLSTQLNQTFDADKAFNISRYIFASVINDEIKPHKKNNFDQAGATDQDKLCSKAIEDLISDVLEADSYVQINKVIDEFESKLDLQGLPKNHDIRDDIKKLRAISNASAFHFIPKLVEGLKENLQKKAATPDASRAIKLAQDKISALHEVLSKTKVESSNEIIARLSDLKKSATATLSDDERKLLILLTVDKKNLTQAQLDYNESLVQKYSRIISLKQQHEYLNRQHIALVKMIEIYNVLGDKESVTLIRTHIESLKGEIERSNTRIKSAFDAANSLLMDKANPLGKSVVEAVKLDKFENVANKNTTETLSRMMGDKDNAVIGSTGQNIARFHTTTSTILTKAQSVSTYASLFKFTSNSVYNPIQNVNGFVKDSVAKWEGFTKASIKAKHDGDLYYSQIASDTVFQKLIDQYGVHLNHIQTVYEKFQLLSEIEVQLKEHVSTASDISAIRNDKKLLKLLSHENNSKALTDMLQQFDKQRSNNIRDIFNEINQLRADLNRELSREKKLLQDVDVSLMQRRRYVASHVNEAILPKDKNNVPIGPAGLSTTVPKQKAVILINNFLEELNGLPKTDERDKLIRQIDGVLEGRSPSGGMYDILEKYGARQMLAMVANLVEKNAGKVVPAHIANAYVECYQAVKQDFNATRETNEKSRIKLRDQSHVFKFKSQSPENEKLESIKTSLLDALNSYGKMVALLEAQRDFMRTPDELAENQARIDKYKLAEQKTNLLLSTFTKIDPNNPTVTSNRILRTDIRPSEIFVILGANANNKELPVSTRKMFHDISSQFKGIYPKQAPQSKLRSFFVRDPSTKVRPKAQLNDDAKNDTSFSPYKKN